MKTLLIAAAAFVAGGFIHFAFHEPPPVPDCRVEVDLALVRYRMADLERRVRTQAAAIQAIGNEAVDQQMRVHQITNQ